MASQSTLTMLLYCPVPDARETWFRSALARVQALLSGIKLAYTYDAGGAMVPVDDPGAALGRAAAGDGTFFLCADDRTGGETAVVSGSIIPAFPVGHRQPIYDLHADLPFERRVIEGATELLGGLGHLARAYWGEATSGESTAKTGHPEEVDPTLPKLRPPYELAAPWIPGYLGWLNYWSAQTCEALGFPDANADAELMERSKPVPGGGWIVALTEEPLDFSIPEHVEALRRVYNRFPQIGGRDTGGAGSPPA